jgi:hypothetical protein
MEAKKKQPNYKALFIIGITFLGAGVAISSSAGWAAGTGILAIGIVFMAIGLGNKEKWN